MINVDDGGESKGCEIVQVTWRRRLEELICGGNVVDVCSVYVMVNNNQKKRLKVLKSQMFKRLLLIVLACSHKSTNYFSNNINCNVLVSLQTEC